jgi:hypothetical protein
VSEDGLEPDDRVSCLGPDAKDGGIAFTIPGHRLPLSQPLPRAGLRDSRTRVTSTEQAPRMGTDTVVSLVNLTG